MSYLSFILSSKKTLELQHFFRPSSRGSVQKYFSSGKSELFAAFLLPEKEGEQMNDCDNGYIRSICVRWLGISSIVTLQANYGSILYAGERYRLHLCGGCIDNWLREEQLHISRKRIV